MNIQRYELRTLNQQDYELLIYVDDQSTEFADEFGTDEKSRQSLKETCQEFVKKKFADKKVTLIKIIVGGMLVASFPFVLNEQDTFAAEKKDGTTAQTSQAAINIYYTVSPNETLWTIAKAYQTTIEQIKLANRMTSDTVYPGQRLIVPKAIHTVKAGDYLSVLARNYQTSVAAIKEANQLTSDQVQIGQKLIIPAQIYATQAANPTECSKTYTVASGDSLSMIAKRFGITVDALKQANKLTSDKIQVGQKLTIPAKGEHSVTIQPVDSVYTVSSGDSLSAIAKRFGVTVDQLKQVNDLRNDTIFIGQKLVIPNGNITSPTSQATTYTVKAGDSLSAIAKRFQTTVDAIRTTNRLSSDTIYIGQTLKIPGANASDSVNTERTTFSYTVSAGDSLSVIAKRFGVTVDAIQTANKLSSDQLQIGQTLTIPNGIRSPGTNTVSYITHTVVSGDNIWDLSVRYGIPQAELLQANNLTTSSILSIGQKLKIPVHTIAPKPVVGEQYGELLDWWTEAQYVFPIGKTATVTDLVTGKSFKIKRTTGANHADSETLTITDTNIAKSIWGGYSWTPRAVVLNIDGRKVAASMSFMPHDVDYIANNGITGHFDVYFANCIRHKDGKPDPNHQAMVEKAAGIKK